MRNAERDPETACLAGEGTVDNQCRNGNQIAKRKRCNTEMDDLVDLDEHRGIDAQNAARIRRQRLPVFQAGQMPVRYHRQDFEKLFLPPLVLASPAETWPEAASKARYLIQLFAATPEAQNARHQWLIANALDDLTRLCDNAKEPS
jgi:hypothetical protein